MQSETKNCQNCHQSFTIEPDDFTFYEKMTVPPPTWCPRCRMVRRMFFRNLRTLYRRKCDFSGKELFSIFHPNLPIRIYDDANPRIVEKINPFEFGAVFDETRPFLAQLYDLSRRMPWPAMPFVLDMVDSPYSLGGWLKNCYLCFNAGYDENCSYSVTLSNSKDCFDVDYSDRCELSASGIGLNQCYRTFYSVDCSACRDVILSRDLRSCSDCFGCAGLRNKRYHIFNKQHSKEEYESELRVLMVQLGDNIEKIEKQARDVWKSVPVKFSHQTNAIRSTGDFLVDCSNVRHSYFATNAKDCAYSQLIYYGPSVDIFDATYAGVTGSRIYEADEVGVNSSNIRFSWDVLESYNCDYCMHTRNCSDCFGCVGLMNEKNCILNRRYSVDEYMRLKTRIIHQMNDIPYRDSRGSAYPYGEFFPPEFSFHAYNESTAQEFFLLEKSDVENKGYRWADRIPVEQIPADAQKCPSLYPSECMIRFRTTPDEREFYNRMGLPLPRECFACRHRSRLQFLNPLELVSRSCECAGNRSENGIYQNTAKHQHGAGRCPNEFETSYSPDRKEIVYCESCYNAEVV